MHKFAKQIMDCVKAHVDGIGIENFEGQNLDDLKDWTEIAKNIVCFDKDYNIVEAMKSLKITRILCVCLNSTRIIQTEDFTTITAMQMADSHRKDVEHAEDMQNRHIIIRCRKITTNGRECRNTTE